MDREAKIKILKAIAAGKGLEGIAKKVPPTYACRFNRAELQARVKLIYGESAKLIVTKTGYYVIGSMNEGLWFVLLNPDQSVTEMFPDTYNPRTFTQQEYQQIRNEMDGLTWEEGKTYEDRLFEFKKAEHDTESQSRDATDHPGTDSKPGPAAF